MSTSPFWQERGEPWDYDPGPPANRSWSRLFAETPNYRKIGKAATGSEAFRWHQGPMFYRGRLWDGQVKVLVIGQEGAQDESLAHRSFTGGTGARMQHFLRTLGITRSYLFLNTFVYPIFGQYDAGLSALAQDPGSAIAIHRARILDYVLERQDLHLVVAVGRAAKESVVSWVTRHGSSCPDGATDVSSCGGAALGPHTRLVGVVHPGSAASGSTAPIKADFQRAIDQIKLWTQQDPSWLPPDPDGQRDLDLPYVYGSAPIPFRDFPIGSCWRLGRGGTSSNRRDGQRCIQLFSEGGHYNNQGDHPSYPDLAPGSPEGYAEEPGDLPYEPPKANHKDFDRGPGAAWARLLLGGKPGLAWPDFGALGVTAHPSLGQGPIYRGRPDAASLLVLADPQGHDDLFTGRALCGEAGQRFQAYLEAIGLTRSYLIIRSLPVDVSDLGLAQRLSLVRDASVSALQQAIVDRARARNPGLACLVSLGPLAADLAGRLDLGGLPHLALPGWDAPGAQAAWQAALPAFQGLAYARDVASPSFQWNGARGQIPRQDLPYGSLRWQGSSGDRAQRATDGGQPSPDYYRIAMPDWVFGLPPAP